MALRQSPGSTSKESEPRGEAGKQLLRGQDVDAGSRQLNGQRQSIQAHTDLGNGTSVGCCELEVWPDRLCPLHKEGDRCRAGQHLMLWQSGEIGSASGATGNRYSACTRKALRLVTTIFRVGHTASNSPTSEAAGSRCSKLS